MERSTGDHAEAIVEGWARELPGAPTDSVVLVSRLWGAAQTLLDERHRLMRRLGMEPAVLSLLSELRRAGSPYEQSAGELAARGRVTAGAVSQRVTKAEASGYVTRRRPDPDGRTVRVALTEHGARECERVATAVLEHDSTLLAELDPGVRAQLVQALGVLTAHLRERLPEGRALF